MVLDLRGLTGRRLEHAWVSELLPELGSEAELVRHLRRPGACRERARRPIKRAVDLDGIEVPRVKGQLVLIGEFGWIEDPVPGPFALGIAPTRGADKEPGRRRVRGRHPRFYAPKDVFMRLSDTGRGKPLRTKP